MAHTPKKTAQIWNNFFGIKWTREKKEEDERNEVEDIFHLFGEITLVSKKRCVSRIWVFPSAVENNHDRLKTKIISSMIAKQTEK